MTADLPFDAAAAQALADLAATLTGQARPPLPSPLAAALVLAGAATAGLRDRLAHPPAGTALVQESLRCEGSGHFAPGAPVAARADLDESVPEGPMLRAAFDQPATGAAATLTAGLRRVDAASLSAPAPDARARVAGATRLRTAPVAPDAVAAYLAAVGDPNPIHKDPRAARALGLAGPVAPGGLLALLAEATALAALGAVAAARTLSGRFLSPARVGEPLELAVLPRPAAGAAAQSRVLVLTPALRLLAVLDLTA